MSYFNCHTHTMYSNIRLLDCINQPKKLIDKAIELGLSGIAITDHECISAHMEVNDYAEKIKKEHPDFKIALGNEIYLVDSLLPGQKYYHFILIAKDAIGHKQLRKLSTMAWTQSYSDRGLERVPLQKWQLRQVIEEDKGHLIATSACIGGELSFNALIMQKCEMVNDIDHAGIYYINIKNFLDFCLELFGDDFYIECAPSDDIEQILVNQKLYKIAQAYNIKMVSATDAHYMTKNDRLIHKAYLNSKDGDREVDSFYKFTYLMDEEEISSLLTEYSFHDSQVTKWILNNTLELQNKIQDYSLKHKQIIPKVEVRDYPKNYQCDWINNREDIYPTLYYLKNSNNIQERYWFNECVNGLNEKNLQSNKEYWQRLETEADVIKYIGEQLEDCLFAYFNTFKHYIDLFWECGSIVGPGRGSATGFLSNYLLGITQLDPIRWGLQYWRFLNKERAELPNIFISGSCKKRTLTYAYRVSIIFYRLTVSEK